MQTLAHDRNLSKYSSIMSNPKAEPGLSLDDLPLADSTEGSQG
jgi:hypothetical protein